MTLHELARCSPDLGDPSRGPWAIRGPGSARLPAGRRVQAGQMVVKAHRATLWKTIVGPAKSLT